MVRIDPDGTVTEWKRDLCISNTVCWSPDHTRFYTADTPPNELWVFDYDPASGCISNQRPFFTGFSRGKPDGSTVDADGYLWNCRYGGRCIVRVAPDGEIERVIEMPVSNITTCTFGGPDLTTLYITTAGLGAPPGERHAGGLFTIETNVRDSPRIAFAHSDRRAKVEATDRRYPWLVVAMLWCICFFNYADRQAIFSVFPLLQKEMNLSLVQLGG